jgi:hypothetical protein
MAKIIVKLSILCFPFIIFAILGLVLDYNVFQVGYQSSYIDKVRRLESLRNTRKAVFVGGSATHFGIQAELFEKETSIAALNMGLHGDVAFKIYMDNVLPYLKNGDAVFLCPEYEYYSRKFDETNKESIKFIYMTYLADATIFKNTSLFYKLKTVPGVPMVLMMSG